MPELPSPAEKELLLQIAEGSEECFTQLFLRYHHLLGSHVYRFTNSLDLAEKIVQDVFLKIWISREALATVEDFKPYLFVVSKNHTLNCLRKLANERVQAQENYLRNVRQVEREQDVYHSLLDEAIDQLPTLQQKVYLLSRHERLRYKEVASRLNVFPRDP